MDKITCVIIDDEPLAIKLLENFVSRTPFLALKASYTDSVQAISDLRNESVDIVFLDIQMPDINGMELSKMLMEETRIIFTTAFKEYAFDSYSVNALDFLLKPIRYNKFLEAAEKAKTWFELQEKSATQSAVKLISHPKDVYIKIDGMFHRVDLDHLLYVMGMKDYMVFQMMAEHDDRKEESLISHITMTHVEALLPPDRFLRVNRSYIVALDKINAVDKNDCIHIGHEIIHITDIYKAAFQKYMDGRVL